MHHRSAGKVQSVADQYASFSPHRVGQWIINEGGPKQHEQQHGAELHALGKGSRNQGCRDDGKHQLKDHENVVGNGIYIGAGFSPHSLEKAPPESSPEHSVVEGQTVTV